MMPTAKTNKICSQCQSQYLVSPDTTDYVHDCSVTSNETLKNEDVLVLGNWSDYTGSGTKQGAEVMFQGISNEVWGTRAGIDGVDVDPVTSRGANQATHRSRTKLTYLDLHEGKQ